MTTTLLAVTGLSPAIVTETVWALATREGILPDRVEFITTTIGAEKLESALFSPLPDWDGATVWATLRHALRAGPDQLIAGQPQIITIGDGSSGRALPLDDIRTPAENAAAAEFIFSRVWDVVHDKDRCLIASVAGGRKTMGALLHSAVSLIARETDRINHVLVSPPFDSLPGFFFPGQPACPVLDRQGRAWETADAEITLADIPFVPLRNRFRELDELPGSFLSLRDQWSEQLKHDADRPVPLRIDHASGVLEIDGTPYPIRARALAILHFILESNLHDRIPSDQTAAADDFNKWNNGTHPLPETLPQLLAEDFRRELNYLRKRLKSSPWKPAMRTLRQTPFTLETAPD
ncbi:MAG: CRISPR-associated ring nuclease Csm6 [Verrucomicrobiales bacterium]|nr:CRISPR-associated ring nuclease Csm6 [Verrucomicrobiota bacterium JB025]